VLVGVAVSVLPRRWLIEGFFLFAVHQRFFLVQCRLGWFHGLGLLRYSQLRVALPSLDDSDLLGSCCLIFGRLISYVKPTAVFPPWFGDSEGDRCPSLVPILIILRLLGCCLPFFDLNRAPYFALAWKLWRETTGGDNYGLSPPPPLMILPHSFFFLFFARPPTTILCQVCSPLILAVLSWVTLFSLPLPDVGVVASMSIPHKGLSLRCHP